MLENECRGTSVIGFLLFLLYMCFVARVFFFFLWKTDNPIHERLGVCNEWKKGKTQTTRKQHRLLFACSQNENEILKSYLILSCNAYRVDHNKCLLLHHAKRREKIPTFFISCASNSQCYDAPCMRSNQMMLMM